MLHYLFILFLTLTAAEARTRIPGEWILTFERESRSNSWDVIRTQMRSHYNFIRNFGPKQRHALFSYNGKKSSIPFRLPNGVKVQPNFTYSLLEADPDFGRQWALKNFGQEIGSSGKGVAGADLDAVRAWDLFTGNRSQLIAILDTGIEAQHPDLQRNNWKNEKEVPANGVDDDGNGFVDDTNGWNFVDQNSNTHDENSHGTMVAGIIGADTENGKGVRGVLKETSMMTLKILDENGTGTTERAISAIEYAVRKGAKIINASWGSRSYDPALYDSVRWAGDQGVLFITAAGNSANDNDNDPSPVYPASFKLSNLISVISTDNRDERSQTSSYGKETSHLAAPGVQIYSTTTDQGFRFGNGTSFAAPHVSAAAALLKGFTPNLSFLEVKERLLASTVPLHYYERDRSQSGGKLNLWNALKNIRPERHSEPKNWKRVTWNRATAHPYENFDTISWTVTHPGATHLRVHFVKFQTEAAYDLLTLKDREGKTVRVYSGDLESFTSMDSLGDTLNLEFVADYVKSAFGLEIDYYEYTTD